MGYALVKDRVSVEPLRDEFVRLQEKGEITCVELARRLGWIRGAPGKKELPDSSRVQRTLGLRPWVDGNGRKYVSKTMNYDRAVELTRAMGADPVDVGI